MQTESVLGTVCWNAGYDRLSVTSRRRSAWKQADTVRVSEAPGCPGAASGLLKLKSHSDEADPRFVVKTLAAVFVLTIEDVVDAGGKIQGLLIAYRMPVGGIDVGDHIGRQGIGILVSAVAADNCLLA